MLHSKVLQTRIVIIFFAVIAFANFASCQHCGIRPKILMIHKFSKNISRCVAHNSVECEIAT